MSLYEQPKNTHEFDELLEAGLCIKYNIQSLPFSFLSTNLNPTYFKVSLKLYSLIKVSPS